MCATQIGGAGSLTVIKKFAGRNQHFLVGVPNWNLCGKYYMPEVHQNVISNLDWIKTYTQEIQVAGETNVLQGNIFGDDEGLFHIKFTPN